MANLCDSCFDSRTEPSCQTHVLVWQHMIKADTSWYGISSGIQRPFLFAWLINVQIGSSTYLSPGLGSPITCSASKLASSALFWLWSRRSHLSSFQMWNVVFDHTVLAPCIETQAAHTANIALMLWSGGAMEARQDRVRLVWMFHSDRSGEC